jgi:hypothetical protein
MAMHRISLGSHIFSAPLSRKVNGLEKMYHIIPLPPTRPDGQGWRETHSPSDTLDNVAHYLYHPDSPMFLGRDSVQMGMQESAHFCMFSPLSPSRRRHADPLSIITDHDERCRARTWPALCRCSAKALGTQGVMKVSQFPSTLARMIEGSAAEARWKSLRPHRRRASGHD